MSTKYYFNNRQISLPGAYSTIVSGETNPARTTDYGKVLVIDTGVAGAGYGGGSGIKGTLASGQDAIYSFLNLQDFRNFQKGGTFWKIAEALFNPDPTNPAAVGISELYFARACSTTPATMTLPTTAGGSFVFKTRDEGLWANGTLEEEQLVSGYAFQVVPGVIDPTKWIMKIYRGTFTGLAEDGFPFGDETALQTVPQLICESPEFNNIQTLIDWGKTNKTFNVSFVIDATSKVIDTGKVDQADITALANYVLATGGTETYNPTNVDDVLSQVTGLDFNIVFTDQFGASANSTITKKVLTQLAQVSKFMQFLYVGGYGSVEEFNDSLALAQGFDSDRVICVHGNAGLNSEMTPVGYRWWGVMYMLASVVGRVSGKPPYIPVTNKTIGIDRIEHTLSDTQKTQALDAGLLVVTKNDYIKKFVVLQGVNTLQDNANLFNSKGQSFSIQFMRIVAQINRELVVNAELDLLSQENGVNVNTLSAGVVKNWTVAYLQSRVATETTDNLLLRFQDVNVTRQEDAWFVTYKIALNNEINKLFFTGFLVR